MPAREQYKKKRLEKRANYGQLACEIKKRRPGFKVRVVPLVISVFCGGVKEILKELENMFEKDDLRERIVAEMQKTISMDSENIIRKVFSELVQSD